MRFEIFISLVCLFFIRVNAHSVKEAYFKINETENSIIINAEFPWTIRKALFQFEPSLNITKDKQNIDSAFFRYIKLNLILKDIDGNSIKLLNVTEDKNEGHSHQTNYTFIFDKGSLFEINNKIMFNLNDEHVNYHTILNSSNSDKIITSKNNAFFTIKPKNISNNKFYWFIITILVLFLGFVFKRLNRKNAI